MAKVSVIIPTYNRAEFLRLAVNSVINQTFQDFEIIIVDYASNDKTREVISQFDDNRIKYIGREKSGGPSEARNEGIINSHCEYIAFLDDDDEWLPEKLQRQIQILENSPQEIGGIYTGRINVDGVSGKILSTRLVDKRGDIFHELLSQFTIPTSSVIVRKFCFEKVGLFDETIFFAEDRDMWVRISMEFQFECIEEPLIKYRIHQKNANTNLDKVIKGKERMLEKYEQWYKKNPKSLSMGCLELGMVYSLNGMSSKGKSANLRAISLNPFRIKPYFIFVLSCLGTNVFRKVIEMNKRLNMS